MASSLGTMGAILLEFLASIIAYGEKHQSFRFKGPLVEESKG